MQNSPRELTLSDVDRPGPRVRERGRVVVLVHDGDVEDASGALDGPAEVARLDHQGVGGSNLSVQAWAVDVGSHDARVDGEDLEHLVPVALYDAVLDHAVATAVRVLGPHLGGRGQV